MVNGQKVSREKLAVECLRHYGEEVLESYVNKRLIAIECKQHGISVAREEIQAEIERMATGFGIPVKQWYQMLEKERGIKPSQYAEDIVWPTLALRKLAGDRLAVSDEELSVAYETQFGPSVQCRLISCSSPQTAEEIRAQAVNNPDGFGDLAKDRSEDTTSASIKGRIPPIHMHAGNEAMEKAAFSMEDGQISPILEVDGQYVILKREKGIPARNIDFELVRPRLEKMIEQRKLRTVANDIFLELQEKAQVNNILNDPENASKCPASRQLSTIKRSPCASWPKSAIKRHGNQVLEGMINRILIEQACEKHNIMVSDRELNDEVVHAAEVSVEPKADGSPDVEAWIEVVTKQQGISREVYIRDSVWPSVALKKLVGNIVKITEEDIQRGFEANYGPKVRCRAIVLDNLRRAQKVWEMARENPDPEHFGRLAKEYSVEAASRELNGQVPPVKKHGGQPVLEREAFALKPGEISGVIQAGGHYVILLCEGYTTPVNVEIQEVRSLIVEDIHDKKMHKAMAQYFQQLQENATIDNYLAGSSQAPTKQVQARNPQNIPNLRQTPARR